MIENLFIKVCGIRVPENRESLEQLPVDYFGFIFYPGSPRYVGNLEPDDLKLLLSTARFRTGVFVDAPAGEVISTALQHHLSHVQLHGTETPADCEKIRRAGFKVIRSFSVHPEFDFNVCEPFTLVCDLFLFDTKGKEPGGTGKKFNCDILENYRSEVPFFLSGGIAPGDEAAIAAFRHPMLYGIDLNSGFEDAPGIKNFGKVNFFMEKLSENLKLIN
jgi:phosphoribosylanthranilate isomerase